jgi:hypothetical protein
MASGLPTPERNNADIDALDVNLDTIATWYAARQLPWGVRVPVEWELPIGRPLFTKRCFGLPLTRVLPRQPPGGIPIQPARAIDLDAYVSTDAAVFDDDPGLTRRWVTPVLGTSSFTHWLARANGAPPAWPTPCSTWASQPPTVRPRVEYLFHYMPERHHFEIDAPCPGEEASPCPSGPDSASSWRSIG